MNVNSQTYYTSGIMFTDAMKTAGAFFSHWDDWVNWTWDSGKINEIPCDTNGYPLALPILTSDNHSNYVRFCINNYYKGKYRILYDGAGKFGGQISVENSNFYISFDANASTEYKYIDILESKSGDHLRNIRVVPVLYEYGAAYPTFINAYLDGLRPFHALRFMESSWINWNIEIHWSNRVLPHHYSQGTRGLCLGIRD